MKRLLSKIWLALAIVASPSLILAQNAPNRLADAAIVVLITEQEAAMAPRKTNPVALASGNDADNRAITRNPKIILASPDATATTSPIHFEIKFVAYNAAQIEPKRVKLTYLKDSPVDLTSRVAAFIRSDGIDVPRAQVAAGKHQIQIEVVDTEGRQATQQLTLEVGQ
jgi:hypothetical protein